MNSNPPTTLRLHISPFNPELLDRIIPPSLRPLTCNISFHAVQTFPDRGFGYVELPAMEAQKLKKKLHGSTLRGTKVRIEEAKPERKRKSEDEDGGDMRKLAKRANRQAKLEHDVLPGHELSEGRRVKRGWTEDSAGQKSLRKQRVKDTAQTEQTEDRLEGRKLRFKTSLPPNAAANETSGKEKPKKKKKSEKQRTDDKKKVVVQEFDKSTTPATGHSKEDYVARGLSYEEGVGWMDEDGNIIEAERKSKRPKASKSMQEPERRTSAIESREVPEEAPIIQQEAPPPADMSLDEDNEATNPNNPTSTPPPADSVHPLEALFKRPAVSASASSRKRPVPINTAFSFFDAETGAPTDNAGEVGDQAMPPQTPHTKRDLEWRSIRSAAPTPDTAALGKGFSFPFGEEEDEDDEEEEQGLVADVQMDDAEQIDQAVGGGEESAFRKWFYENRGDLNRGWKRRRREEKKLVRQRENRRLSRRVVA